MKPIKEDVSELNKRIAETFPGVERAAFDPKEHQIAPPPLPVLPAEGGKNRDSKAKP